MSTTENLLQKLEEKMVTLLSEVESSRKDIHELRSENAALRIEIERNVCNNQKNMKKVEELLLLVDTVTSSEHFISNVSNIADVAPLVVQG